MKNSQKYECLTVNKSPAGEISRRIEQRVLRDLQKGFVRVRIRYSALNFKDALAATGNPGVALSFPLVPGIDAVGTVLDGNGSTFSAGESVLIAHPDFGTRTDGGYAQMSDVPEDWLMALPKGLSELETITLGTAGFTAAQCVQALLKNKLHPDDGEVIVTGSTGGVGIMGVMILAKLGFRVVASTGKTDRTDSLMKLGASRVVSREEVVDHSNRPLLSAKWAGSIDTVGGETLTSILRSTKPHCAVTACGLVGGNELNMTVYPFILRGVSLIGIDSALVKADERRIIWAKLGQEWRLNGITELAKVVSLAELESEIENILHGRIFGRVVVDLK